MRSAAALSKRARPVDRNRAVFSRSEWAASLRPFQPVTLRGPAIVMDSMLMLSLLYPWCLLRLAWHPDTTSRFYRPIHSESNSTVLRRTA